jgi:hypothetical protein
MASTTVSPADIEGLGVFYLGRRVDPDALQPLEEPILLDARRLTTHAVCVGMTGSGKTGLLVDLIEEAALDGIPAIVVDPKGDLANLLLTFPELAPDDFRPWLDPEAAIREGISLDDLAARTAATWSAGLAASGQTAERIRRLRANAEMAVYTPGSRAGQPLAMLGSFEPPATSPEDDPEQWRERIESLVAGILALIGMDVAPNASREHVLLAAIIDSLWKSGHQVDFGSLVRAIPAPPIERIGFLDLDNFCSPGDRFQLASRLNTVAAAPGFEAWIEGESLDVGRLLWSPAGRPRVSVVSIAHLTEPQRMAFVTLLAGQTVSWMRSQRGTSSLRAIFLMDEVFGYLPPTANPPSKQPLLTLLKQARAYGLGVVLATQNPVDLDYKGLSNAGLWFLGRLQTARDKARVLDGLEGAAASSGRSLDRGRVDRLLSGLGQRRFLLHSVHEDDETVFETRWTMAYLRGPMLREEIRRLTDAVSGQVGENGGGSLPDVASTEDAGPRPLLPPGVTEVFVAPHQGSSGAVLRSGECLYRPALLGRARIRYSLASARIDTHRQVVCMAPAGDALGETAWEAGRMLAVPPTIEPAPRPGGFATLPGPLNGPKAYQSLAIALKNHLTRSSRLVVWRAGAIDAVSDPGESEAAFRLRIAQRLREWRDAEMDRVRERYASKRMTLADRIDRARQKVQREKAEARNQSLQTYVSVGTAILDALLRRKATTTTVGKAATSMRSASRSARQQADVAHAEESLATLLDRQESLEAEVTAALERIRLESSLERVVLERLEIPARKADSVVEDVVLAWVPGDVSVTIATLAGGNIDGGHA